jgi:DNA-binding NtrC family response regulator
VLFQEIAERFGRLTRGLAPDAIRAIQAHSWPGNVRELDNRIKGAVIMADGPVVMASDLGLEDPGDEPEHLNLRVARQRAEAPAVRQSLAVAGGNLSRAAKLLGVTRPMLYDLLAKIRSTTVRRDLFQAFALLYAKVCLDAVFVGTSGLRFAHRAVRGWVHRGRGSL